MRVTSRHLERYKKARYDYLTNHDVPYFCAVAEAVKERYSVNDVIVSNVCISIVGNSGKVFRYWFNASEINWLLDVDEWVAGKREKRPRGIDININYP
jgi:hypothetical protein